MLMKGWETDLCTEFNLKQEIKLSVSCIVTSCYRSMIWPWKTVSRADVHSGQDELRGTITETPVRHSGEEEGYTYCLRTGPVSVRSPAPQSKQQNELSVASSELGGRGAGSEGQVENSELVTEVSEEEVQPVRRSTRVQKPQEMLTPRTSFTSALQTSSKPNVGLRPFLRVSCLHSLHFMLHSLILPGSP